MEVNAIVEITHTSDIPRISDALSHGAYIAAAAQPHGAVGLGGAPWARSSKNVKKPQSQMCESCRKA